MAKIKFRKIKMSAANKRRLKLINEIIEEYQAQGYVLTLRQLYYQLVSRDIIPNKQAEYSKLSNLLKEGRMAGIVDWEAIEDRLRKPSRPAAFDSPQDIINQALRQYRKDRQLGQNTHIEVWVEKDALSGVLKRVTEKYGIRIMVNRGYSSASAMYDSYERFYDAFQENQKVKILYLGDFDPSGVDMVRDIKSRIDEFIVGSEEVKSMFEVDTESELYNDVFNHLYEKGSDSATCHKIASDMYLDEMAKDKAGDFEIIPIALTKEQINHYQPPPNPAKITDPRAKEFISKHGNTSWEVDALRPQVLNQILEDAILENIDLERYETILTEEIDDKEKLRKLSENL